MKCSGCPDGGWAATERLEARMPAANCLRSMELMRVLIAWSLDEIYRTVV